MKHRQNQFRTKTKSFISRIVKAIRMTGNAKRKEEPIPGVEEASDSLLRAAFLAPHLFARKFLQEAVLATQTDPAIHRD